MMSKLSPVQMVRLTQLGLFMQGKILRQDYLVKPNTTNCLCLIAFVVTGIGVFLVQKFTVEEDTGSALAKGFTLGVLAGIPTPIAGTLAGGVVIAKAGIRAIRGRD